MHKRQALTRIRAHKLFQPQADTRSSSKLRAGIYTCMHKEAGSYAQSSWIAVHHQGHTGIKRDGKHCAVQCVPSLIFQAGSAGAQEANIAHTWGFNALPLLLPQLARLGTSAFGACRL